MLRTFVDPEALAVAAADEVASLARASVAARGGCHLALSGGSTPKRLFQVLAAMGKGALPWDHIDLWWGDERTVAPDHADSNYRMAREALIIPLQLDPMRVHRMQGELADPVAAAAAYEQALVTALGTPPVFDVVLLGMGPDGHTASLFPGSPALGETRRAVVANPVDSPLTKGPTTRLTLTAPALNAARHIRFLVAGADKAGVLARVLEGPRGTFPAQAIAPVAGDLVWFIDRAAAAQLVNKE